MSGSGRIAGARWPEHGDAPNTAIVGSVKSACRLRCADDFEHASIRASVSSADGIGEKPCEKAYEPPDQKASHGKEMALQAREEIERPYEKEIKEHPKYPKDYSEYEEEPE